MQQLAMQEVARLQAIVSSEGGSGAFPALAEALRRCGRPEEAERVARGGLRRHPDHTAGRVALGLALIDLARLDEARGELTRVLDAVPDHALAEQALAGSASGGDLLDEVGDSELDQAFAAAEAQRDEMIDADGVAAATVRAVEVDAEDDEVPVDTDSPFANETVANLLERQGHGDEADRIRGAIRLEDGDDDVPTRRRAVAALEGWLENIQKGRR